MRRIAVISQKPILPALIAGSLSGYGGVTAVWADKVGTRPDGAADRHAIAMPHHTGGQAHCSAEITEPYCGAEDYLLSCARTPDRLSLAANLHTADILAAGDCHTGRMQLGKAVKPIIASDSRRLRKAIIGNANDAICCGTCSTDTVTLSSINSDRLIVTLQRELTTLSGQTVEPCDIRVEFASSEIGIIYALITTAVLLLCDCPPEPGYKLFNRYPQDG